MPIIEVATDSFGLLVSGNNNSRRWATSAENFSFLAGQTKHFQVFYRDDMGAVCGSGQNTSNAITVLIEP